MYTRTFTERSTTRTRAAGAAKIVTAWFESFSNTLYTRPPDIRAHPELQLGDLFYHYTATQYQLWMWTEDSAGSPRWMGVFWGYERADGLRLTLTPTTRKPSWVNERRFKERQRDCEYHAADGVDISSLYAPPVMAHGTVEDIEESEDE